MEGLNFKSYFSVMGNVTKSLSASSVSETLCAFTETHMVLQTAYGEMLEKGLL